MNASRPARAGLLAVLAGLAFAPAAPAQVVPALCRLSAPRAGTGQLMSYCWDTIDQCVPAERIMESLRQAGFDRVRCDTSLSVFRDYQARRPD